MNLHRESNIHLPIRDGEALLSSFSLLTTSFPFLRGFRLGLDRGRGARWFIFIIEVTLAYFFVSVHISK